MLKRFKIKPLCLIHHDRSDIFAAELPLGLRLLLNAAAQPHSFRKNKRSYWFHYGNLVRSKCPLTQIVQFLYKDRIIKILFGERKWNGYIQFV